MDVPFTSDGKFVSDMTADIVDRSCKYCRLCSYVR